MIKRLTKVGNSSALILDKTMMGLLGLTAESDIEVTTDGLSILITPVGMADRRPDFKKAAAAINSMKKAGTKG
jgi:antitoxin MazE